MRTHSEPSEPSVVLGNRVESAGSDDAAKDVQKERTNNNVNGHLKRDQDLLQRHQDEESFHRQQFNHPGSASVMLTAQHHHQVGVGSSTSLVDHVFFWHNLQQQLATSILANSVRHHHQVDQ